MKFSEQWLREWFHSDIDRDSLLERLTMAGLEVDDVQPAAADFNAVVVAEVTSVEPHPDADKLRVCQVTNGAETFQIVCGASNVREGLKVPLAMIGAKLPNGLKIKKSKLRGVESFGMLCSEAELGMAESADGLFELPESLTVGEDIREALQLDDTIIELSITPNRGDCFSIAGIARDCVAVAGGELKEPTSKAQSQGLDEARSVSLNVDVCPLYCGRIIKGVNINAPTPLWMVERLRRSDIRSISAIVDITNYVMLEVGQPMHAFDNDKLDGGIQVRYAEEGEKLTLLDDQEYTLNEGDLVIADDSKALALAGIMGGAESSVGDNTKDIFLESAFFKPEAIIGKARKYGLHTDSSHRFERGVDFELPLKAIERATTLILEICGGLAGELVEQRQEQQIPVREAIALRKERIQQLLGIELDDGEIERIFTQLGMAIAQESNADYSITPPSWRFDIAIEADLIEELARVRGYDQIPSQALTIPLHLKNMQVKNTFKKQVAQLLCNRGYQESINYSFIAEELQTIFSPDLPAITLANPIASDMSVMRSSLWPGLLTAMDYNLKRQRPRVRLFELGLVFEQQAELKQNLKLAGVACGNINEEQWDTADKKSDFFDIKNDVEQILKLMGTKDIAFKAAEIAGLHPGQTAEIFSEGHVIGVIGALHPQTVKAMDLEKTAIVFELSIDENMREKVAKCEEISKYPSIRRDLSVIMDEAIPSMAIADGIKKSASTLLTNLQLFDVYRGEHIDIGKKSLTFGLTFQRSSSTLTDTDVETAVEGILQSLQENFQAKLRE